MERLGILALILFSFTGISLINISKAMLTPYHLIMVLVGGWFVLIGKKKNLGFLVSANCLLFYLIFSNYLSYPDIRYTSILYSVVFIIEFIIFYNLIRYCRFKAIEEGLKSIIYLYFVNICIGTILLILGIQLPAIENFIGIVRTTAGNRPMGFSSEPSYAGFILSMTYLCYCHVSKYEFNKSTVKVTIIYFASILLLGSAYGVLLFLVTMFNWFRYFYTQFSQSLRTAFLLVVITIGGIVVPPLLSVENETIQRLAITSAVLNDPFMDTDKKLNKLKEVDPSAFARIGPSYVLFFSEESENFNLWLGEGAGAAGVFIPMLMAGTLIDEDDDEFDTGILPAFIFDYGLIGMGFLVLFMVVCFNGLPFPFWLIFIMMLPNANINTQIFWFGLAIFLMTSMIANTRKKYYNQKVLQNIPPPPISNSTVVTT